MSLYTWIGGSARNRRRKPSVSLYSWIDDQRYGYPYDKGVSGRYGWAAGEVEGRPHYGTEERDLSNPNYVASWNITPPTFIKFNITETYDVQQIKDYVLNLLHNSTGEIIDGVVEQVVERMRNNINLTVQEALEETLIAINEPYLNELIEEAKNGEG